MKCLDYNFFKVMMCKFNIKTCKILKKMKEYKQVMGGQNMEIGRKTEEEVSEEILRNFERTLATFTKEKELLLKGRTLLEKIFGIDCQIK